jgi:hypothetical protein
MFISFDLITIELVELLLQFIATTELDFEGIQINKRSDINRIDVVVLRYILEETRIGLLIDGILQSYVQLCYTVYPELFALHGMNDLDEVMWEARMEMLSHNKLKEYIDFQANLIKHNVIEKDLKKSK